MDTYRRTALTFSGLALLSLLGCDPANVTLDIRGKVTDADSGDPIAGAAVSLLWMKGTYEVEAVGTDSGLDGTYRLVIYELPCDAPMLTAALEPWKTETVDVRCTDADQFIDFALTR